MDTELTTHLMDLKEVTGKIDARTCAVLEGQKELKQSFKEHIKQDHDDFATVHGRINAADSKLNWVLGGVGFGCFVVLAIIGMVAAP